MQRVETVTRATPCHFDGDMVQAGNGLRVSAETGVSALRHAIGRRPAERSVGRRPRALAADPGDTDTDDTPASRPTGGVGRPAVAAPDAAMPRRPGPRTVRLPPGRRGAGLQGCRGLPCNGWRRAPRYRCPPVASGGCIRPCRPPDHGRSVTARASRSTLTSWARPGSRPWRWYGRGGSGVTRASARGTPASGRLRGGHRRYRRDRVAAPIRPEGRRWRRDDGRPER